MCRSWTGDGLGLVACGGDFCGWSGVVSDLDRPGSSLVVTEILREGDCGLSVACAVDGWKELLVLLVLV